VHEIRPDAAPLYPAYQFLGEVFDISSLFHLFEAILNELSVNFCSAIVELLVVGDLVLAASEPLLDVRIFVQDPAIDGLSTNDINTLSLSAVMVSQRR